MKGEEKKELLYPKLSYKIVGILFEVYNNLGHSLQEEHYQRGISSVLRRNKIILKEQVPVKINFRMKKLVFVI